ncbi:lysine--tRNA ligase [bacterium]|jgi:lysyl-tRNA synthetase, class II|nr:lysine--tRNA ligase [bacterium]MBT3581879.1 lysine--tRNA ligase [bacterium]MBT4552296.1 lysine--tRNA ligase [bacterium]MBT5989159.1 lysine--tRNA ligase [bacterium]MBT7087730.1 lysine--tRNA ligase [bacterium]
MENHQAETEVTTNSIIEKKIEKVNALKKAGINPYPYTYDPTHKALEIKDNFAKYQDTDIVKVAGRVMLLRNMGKSTFLNLADQSGDIQIYFGQKQVGEESYELFKKVDVGDIIGVEGTVFKTRTEEITVRAQNFTILTKSIRPLPEKFHGIVDKELRYKHRSLDMIMNKEVKETFLKRALATKLIRNFMDQKGFVEIETPLLDTKYGGGEAKPFSTKVNALDMQVYLSISPELYLKRLMVGGIERVYNIGKSFRNEGIDRTHYPEFTSMEFYLAYADYHDTMKLTEDLYEYVFKTVNGTTKVVYDGQELDFKAPWPRVRMTDFIKQQLEIDVENLTKDEILAQMKVQKITLEEDLDFSKVSKDSLIILLFEEFCEKLIIQPTFVIDFPKESSPLSKAHRQNPELIERFEPFVKGVEIGNGYSELNDPVEQRCLLEDQAQKLRAGLETATPMDERFVEAIEAGLPPASGVGLGIDRMMMFLTGAQSIRDVIAFPICK